MREDGAKRLFGAVGHHGRADVLLPRLAAAGLETAQTPVISRPASSETVAPGLGRRPTKGARLWL